MTKSRRAAIEREEQLYGPREDRSRVSSERTLGRTQASQLGKDFPAPDRGRRALAEARGAG